MATLDQANTDAKFYNEKLVRVTYYDGSVQYYSSKSGLRSMFIPNDYSGSIETLADYSDTNRPNMRQISHMDNDTLKLYLLGVLLEYGVRAFPWRTYRQQGLLSALANGLVCSSPRTLGLYHLTNKGIEFIK